MKRILYFLFLSVLLNQALSGQPIADTSKVYYLSETGAKRAIKMHLEFIQVKTLLEVSNAQIWHLKQAITSLQMQVSLLERNAYLANKKPFTERFSNFINKAGAKILVYAILVGGGIMLILGYSSGFT